MNVDTPDAAFQLLLDSCPAFRPHLEATRAQFYFYGGPPDPVDPYFDVVWINALLVELVRQQETTCFPAVFALLEQLLVNGSSDMKNWVVGVLEGVQNQVSHTELTYAAFEPWLGSETRKEWDGLIEAWGG
jgi:hypothetical protein